MNREEVIKLAREQGLPETETEGVFIVNTDDLGRMLAAEREACAIVCDRMVMYGPEYQVVGCMEDAPTVKITTSHITAAEILATAAGHLKDRAATYDQPQGECATVVTGQPCQQDNAGEA